jgi:hypothetical protein
VQSLVVTRLMDLAADADASPQARSIAAGELRGLLKLVAARISAGVGDDQLTSTREDIERFLARPDEPRRKTRPFPRPPGDPIGSSGQAP